MTAVNQKRIAINTLLLYFRMIVVMLVGLYTSRVIIDALGQQHFGIYDAVGGIVLMVSFISTTMSSACQRYYSYELGKDNPEGMKTVFSISLTVFFILTALIVLLAETLGGWFLANKMDVAGHVEAARRVFQFSILSFSLQILRVPYQGMVIAKEKMKVFAYLSLFEAFATLGIALLLAHAPDNKDSRLVLYSGLMTCIQAATSLFYWLYCRLFYNECRYHFIRDREKFREIFSYAGWNMIGSCADVCKSQGLNLLLNVMFGTFVNAARGVANKVFNTITQLNNNFFTAVRPQLYKSYAAGEMDDMRKLICQSSRFSFYLLFLLALPILLETDFILPIWLRGRNVPEYAYVFTRLMVIEGLINSFTSPFAASVQATGKIRDYQIVIGGTLLLILPLAYVGVRFMGWPPASVFMVSIMISFITQFLRLWFVHRQVGLELKVFLKEVLLPVLLVAITSTSVSLAVKLAGKHTSGYPQWVMPVVVIVASMVITAVTVYVLGVTRTERKHALEMVHDCLGLKKQDS